MENKGSSASPRCLEEEPEVMAMFEVILHFHAPRSHIMGPWEGSFTLQNSSAKNLIFSSNNLRISILKALSNPIYWQHTEGDTWNRSNKNAQSVWFKLVCLCLFYKKNPNRFTVFVSVWDRRSLESQKSPRDRKFNLFLA